MIALYENGQWERKTLRQLKTQFPNVSFRKTSEQDGATWTDGGTDYTAKLVVEVAAPTPAQGFAVEAGPLEDFGGEPRQTWGQVVIIPPTQAEIDAELDALTADVDQGKSLIRVLAKHVYLLEKANGSSQSPTQFKNTIRNELKAL